MGYYCTVPQCTSLAGKTKNVKFHRFPRDVSMADKWNIILKRGKPYTKYSKVCSLHFTQADYNVTTMGQWKTLSKDAVPSQNLPKLNSDGTVMVIRKSRTVKYKEGKKEGDKDKWTSVPHNGHPLMSCQSETAGLPCGSQDIHDSNILAYRLQTLGSLANTISPQHTLPTKPKKQDAIMQTDPVQNEDDDTQPNNSYSEVSDKSYSELDYNTQNYPKNPSPFDKNVYQRDPVPFSKDYERYKDFSRDYKEVAYPKETTPFKDAYKEPNYAKDTSYQKDTVYQKDTNYQKDTTYQKDTYQKETTYQKDTEFPKNYEPKDYTKTSDYIPQTNDEYNKEAEKYALERKSHNGFEAKADNYQKLDLYSFDKYQRDGYYNYSDSAEVLRNQQHNLQILQEQHRVNENQNFFNESHIKQEIDISGDDDKFYDRNKEIESNPMYAQRRHQLILEHLQHQVKQEPDTPNGGETVVQPQSSPYYNGHNNTMPGFYDSLPRPGPELLIAKQNALAAHTQLWQNTMKRPFFYSESTHYNSPHLHRYEDVTRLLQ